MSTGLLATELTTGGLVAAVVFGALAAVSLVYGLIKKFSRMSWSGWQILILFALCMLFGYVPEDGNKTLWFALAIGLFFGASALLFGLGGLVRRAIRNHGKFGHGFNALDRIAGALTALLDWAMFAAAIGGFVLAFLENGGYAAELIAPVTQSGVWAVFGKYAADLILISFLVLFTKGGYRLGLAKLLWTALVLILSFGAVVGAVVLTFRWSFLRGLAASIGASLAGDAISAALIGGIITVAIVAAVFFLVIVAICLIVNLIVKKLNRHTAFNVVDGIFCAVIAALFALAIALGFGLAVNAAAGIDFSSLLSSLPSSLDPAAYEEIAKSVHAVFTGLAQTLASSPFSRLLHAYNPLLALVLPA